MAGKPFNFTGAAALPPMPTQQAELRSAERVRVGGDTHLYRDRLEQVRGWGRRPKSIDGDRIKDVAPEGHAPQPEVAVRC